VYNCTKKENAMDFVGLEISEAEFLELVRWLEDGFEDLVRDLEAGLEDVKKYLGDGVPLGE
jgi:hypothetical protein